MKLAGKVGWGWKAGSIYCMGIGGAARGDAGAVPEATGKLKGSCCEDDARVGPGS